MAAQTPIAHTRNIGIMAHIDAGKTTTSERIVYYAGLSSRMGEVEDGASTMDWMVEEQKRGISITAAATTFVWRGHKINLIDTPGHVDFTIEVERSLRVLDGAIALFDAVAGVEAQTETVWRQADRYHVPRIAFVNKADRVGADLEGAVRQMRDRLRANPLLLQLPIGEDGDFVGVVDLVTMKSVVWDEESLGAQYSIGEIPEELADDAAICRDELLQGLADVDDELMARYLEGRVSEDELRAALRRATIALRVVPVLVGAARRNKGVQPLLDAVVDYLPSPLDIPPVLGKTPTGADTTRLASSAAPLSALVFKITNDPELGPLTYLRVYSGSLEQGQVVFNAAKGSRERTGRLMQMHANRAQEVRDVQAGNIAAVVGLRGARTGDTLCDERDPILLETLSVPSAVVSVTIEPRTAADAEKLAAGLASLAIEDPSFHVTVDPETSQTILAGLGELHLEIIADRLRREHGVDAVVGRPQVAYREVVTQTGEVERSFFRQIGGHGNHGVVRLSVAPNPGKGIEIAPVPAVRNFAAAIEQGIRERAQRGLFAGFPFADLKVTVLSATGNPVDETELGYKSAAEAAFRDAALAAGIGLIEPVMSVVVAVPDEHMGEVIGDLNSRRGRISGMEARNGVQHLAAEVPLAEMFGYATDLRSSTKGRATYSMQFSQYQAVPPSIAATIAARVKGA
jgi:elongation factor G